MTTISSTALNFEREPLRHPFGFKGGALTELWQVVAGLKSETGKSGLGLGLQSVLWSDSALFTGHAEAGGNCLMFLMTEYALREAEGRSFESPIELLQAIYPKVFEFGKQLTGRPNLRPTFALNALVPVDMAAWSLHARENNLTDFDALIPSGSAGAFQGKQSLLAKVPAIAYGTSLEEVRKLVEEGCFCLKIKVGSDPEGDGDQEKMLEWDKRRMSELHEMLSEFSTSHTENGKIAYYLDGNGRYDSKERLLRLVKHLEQIGAMDQVQLFEEPFPEEYLEDVSDIPMRLVADESAHTMEDAIERMDLGYGAIALKPIAKTISMSLLIAQAAHERGVPCFCADLTVNPLMVEWNRNFAVRLAPLPGLKVGVMETNGEQNYTNWQKMLSYHPQGNAEWVRGEAGFFPLSEEFYQTSGGLFDPAPHYESLLTAHW